MVYSLTNPAPNWILSFFIFCTLEYCEINLRKTHEIHKNNLQEAIFLSTQRRFISKWSLIFRGSFYLMTFPINLRLILRGAFFCMERNSQSFYLALGAGSQEICQWAVRSWPLGDPSRKITKGVGTTKCFAIMLFSIKNCLTLNLVSCL